MVPSLDDQFSGRFAHRIRVFTAQRIVLAISELPLAVLVALIAGHYDHAHPFRHLSDGLEQMSSADDVGLERLYRLSVRVHGLPEPLMAVRGELPVRAQSLHWRLFENQAPIVR